MDPSLLNRPVNEGFSGGEKKRNEIFQMAVLDPKLAILDETDSGLDIDALKIVADGVNALRSPDRAMIVVTHYQRLLNYIVPDFVHVLLDGRIVQVRRQGTGARSWRAKGYGWVEAEAAPRWPVGLREERDARSLDPATLLSRSSRERALRRRSRPGCRRCARPRSALRRARVFPTRRDEEWRFTDVTADRARLRFHAAKGRADRCGLVGGVRLCWPDRQPSVFVDGRIRPELFPIAGAARRRESAAADGGAAQTTPTAGAASGPVAEFERPAFVALNTALFDEGAFVHIPRGVVDRSADPPAVLLGSPTTPAAYPRTLIVAGENSQATIVGELRRGRRMPSTSPMP